MYNDILAAMSRGGGNPNIIPVINSRGRGFPHAYLAADMQGFGTSTPAGRNQNDGTPISIGWFEFVVGVEMLAVVMTTWSENLTRKTFYL